MPQARSCAVTCASPIGPGKNGRSIEAGQFGRRESWNATSPGAMVQGLAVFVYADARGVARTDELCRRLSGANNQDRRSLPRRWSDRCGGTADSAVAGDEVW